MDSWRIVKTRLADAAFDGEGARLYGGRWTSPGGAVVYTAEHVSLALLEVLVHLRDGRVLPSYSLCRARFPAAVVQRIEVEALPDGWRRFPAPPEIQVLGDRWLRTRASAVLEVRSAIVPQERNYLLNPAHPDFAEIEIGSPTPFEWDRRLVTG